MRVRFDESLILAIAFHFISIFFFTFQLFIKITKIYFNCFNFIFSYKIQTLELFIANFSIIVFIVVYCTSLLEKTLYLLLGI